MRSNSSKVLLTLGALMVLASLAPAATWTVERDGTGDFTVIQEAVDVAADGDTIRIGPGRYDEKTLFVTPGWSEFVRVIVRQEELTIIGSGPETIIGQEEPWELDQGWHRGSWLAISRGSMTIDGSSSRESGSRTWPWASTRRMRVLLRV